MGDPSPELMYLLSKVLLLWLNYSSSWFSSFKFQDPGWEGLKGSDMHLGVSSSDEDRVVSRRPTLLLGYTSSHPHPRQRAGLKKKQKWLWTGLSELCASQTSVSGLVDKGWVTYQLFILLSKNMVCFSYFVKDQLLYLSNFRPSAMELHCKQAEWRGRVEAHW